jgi:hypothetical protein
MLSEDRCRSHYTSSLIFLFTDNSIMVHHVRWVCYISCAIWFCRLVQLCRLVPRSFSYLPDRSLYMHSSRKCPAPHHARLRIFHPSTSSDGFTLSLATKKKKQKQKYFLMIMATEEAERTAVYGKKSSCQRAPPSSMSPWPPTHGVWSVTSGNCKSLT